MARLIRAVVAAHAAPTQLVGWQPSGPPTTPTGSPPASPSAAATPTFLCTPEAGGAESQCTQAQYDEMKAKDALYAEAEAVFREYFAENIRISRAGGIEEPTEVMLRTTHGAYLADTLRLFKNLRRENLRARGDDPQIVRITRLPGRSKAGSEVALRVCVDATHWAFYSGGRLSTRGIVAEDETYFGRIDGRLLIIGADGKDVEKCA
ncbi:MAG: hypothetical protein AAGC63_00755 [Propionicimonas sp.]|nr:hypothetical protein [Propionicimonas sp.]